MSFSSFAAFAPSSHPPRERTTSHRHFQNREHAQSIQSNRPQPDRKQHKNLARFGMDIILDHDLQPQRHVIKQCRQEQYHQNSIVWLCKKSLNQIKTISGRSQCHSRPHAPQNQRNCRNRRHSLMPPMMQPVMRGSQTLGPRDRIFESGFFPFLSHSDLLIKHLHTRPHTERKGNRNDKNHKACFFCLRNGKQRPRIHHQMPHARTHMKRQSARPAEQHQLSDP